MHFPHFQFISLSIEVSFASHNSFSGDCYFGTVTTQLQYFNEKSSKSNFYLVGEMKSLPTWGFQRERESEKERGSGSRKDRQEMQKGTKIENTRMKDGGRE